MENCCKNIFRVCSLSRKPQRELGVGGELTIIKKKVFLWKKKGTVRGNWERGAVGWVGKLGEVEGGGICYFFGSGEKPQQFLAAACKNILRLSRL